MDLFSTDDSLVVSVKGEEVTPISAHRRLENADLVGFYFSADWCPPCQYFTPVLKRFYQDLKSSQQPFEIVTVSQDDAEEDMLDHCRQCPWPALPFGHPLNSVLRKKFHVKTIPVLIVANKKGNVITDQGRTEVIQGPALKVFKQWQELSAFNQ